MAVTIVTCPADLRVQLAYIVNNLTELLHLEVRIAKTHTSHLPPTSAESALSS